MNKNLISLFSLLTILISCSNEKNDLKRANLFGKVKFVKEINYEAVEKFGEIVEGYTLHTYESTYDEKGNLIKWCRESETFLEGIICTEYNVDEKRNQIGITYNSQHNIKYKLVRKNDSNGNEIESNFYDNNSNLTTKVKSELDKNGNAIKDRRYNSDGNLESVTERTFDKNGNCIEAIFTTNTGVVFQKWEEQMYDKFNNMINWKLTIPSGATVHIENKYEFDKNNNWIRQISLQDQKPENVIKREIKYWN